MQAITQILSALEQGEPDASSQLLERVYDELRRLAAQKLAREKPGQTLDATALVHEAYLRLFEKCPEPHFEGRGHFFAAAAEAMRRILIENARRKASAGIDPILRASAGRRNCSSPRSSIKRSWMSMKRGPKQRPPRRSS